VQFLALVKPKLRVFEKNFFIVYIILEKVKYYEEISHILSHLCNGPLANNSCKLLFIELITFSATVHFIKTYSMFYNKSNSHHKGKLLLLFLQIPTASEIPRMYVVQCFKLFLRI